MPPIDPEAAELIRKFLDRVADEGIRIEEAYLFGSFAVGKQNQWSDIDVAVVSRDISDDRFEERTRLMKLSSRIDSRIEPVPFTPETFADEDPLAWEIRRKGIRIDREHQHGRG